MNILIGEVRPGDILVFKRSGPVSFILGGILRMFERKWDGWGWHTGFVSRMYPVPIVCEALAEGVSENYLSNYKPEELRAYRWLDTQPTQDKIDKFIDSHFGKPYDVAIYFWTAAQYLFRHFWNRRIPRLLDDRYTCWENVFEFCEDMGKPIGAKYDCPIITDMLKAFGEC